MDGWACGSARGSMRDVESLGWARRASSGRSQDAAAAAPPRAGGRPKSRGAGVRKKEPAGSARIWGLPAESHSRCAGPSPRTASFPPGSRRRAAGPRAGPRGARAQPVPRAKWTHSLFFFSPWSCLPTFTEEIPDALQSCGSSLTTYPRPSAETPTPKVKREARPSSCARGWLSRSS